MVYGLNASSRKRIWKNDHPFQSKIYQISSKKLIPSSSINRTKGGKLETGKKKGVFFILYGIYQLSFLRKKIITMWVSKERIFLKGFVSSVLLFED